MIAISDIEGFRTVKGIMLRARISYLVKKRI